MGPIHRVKMINFSACYPMSIVGIIPALPGHIEIVSLN